MFEHIDNTVRESISIFLEKSQCTVGDFAGIMVNSEGRFIVSIDRVTFVFIRTEMIVEFFNEGLISCL